jgi:hypothetical protein
MFIPLTKKKGLWREKTNGFWLKTDRIMNNRIKKLRGKTLHKKGVDPKTIFKLDLF